MSSVSNRATDVQASGSATVTDESTNCGESGFGSTGSRVTKHGKLLWDGKTDYSVQEVYLADIVEDLDKDVATKLGKIVTKVIFPNQKFIPNWSTCLTLTHDLEKDVEDSDAGWIHHVFKKMNWTIDDNFPAYQQAIKWNTYKYALKERFDNHRATNIAKLKKGIIGGKCVRIYLFCST